MLDELFEAINVYSKRNKLLLYLLLFFEIISFVAFMYGLYLGYDTENFIGGFITFLCLLPLLFLILIVINNVKSSKYQDQNLLPHLLNDVNFEWKLLSSGFNKEEELKSFMFNRSGSFSSKKTIEGSYRRITYKMGLVTNVVSTGKSSYTVFGGNYIKFRLSKPIAGCLQIRDKGKPTHVRATDKPNEFHNSLTQNESEISFFTTNTFMAEQLLTRDLISLYKQFLNKYNKKVIMTILNQDFIIGINNNKNPFVFSYFSKINRENYDKKQFELKELDNMINDVCQFIERNEL